MMNTIRYGETMTSSAKLCSNVPRGSTSMLGLV